MSIDFISPAYRSKLYASRNSQNYIEQCRFEKMRYEQDQRLEMEYKANLLVKETRKLKKEDTLRVEETFNFEISSSLKLAAFTMMEEHMYDRIDYSLLRIIDNHCFDLLEYED